MMERKYAHVCTVRLVKELSTPSVRISDASAVDKYARPLHFDGIPVERFVVICLNADNYVINSSIVSEGILNSALVHPREVFIRAIKCFAASIILVHNHPSGNGNASAEDIRVTKQLVEAGKILGIPVHDHIILPAYGDYVSMAEQGLM